MSVLGTHRDRWAELAKENMLIDTRISRSRCRPSPPVLHPKGSTESWNPDSGLIFPAYEQLAIDLIEDQTIVARSM